MFGLLFQIDAETTQAHRRRGGDQVSFRAAQLGVAMEFARNPQASASDREQALEFLSAKPAQEPDPLMLSADELAIYCDLCDRALGASQSLDVYETRALAVAAQGYADVRRAEARAARALSPQAVGDVPEPVPVPE